VSMKQTVLVATSNTDFGELRQREVRRISLLSTGVKIALALAYFRGFGVARQGPWITRVNKIPVNAPNPSGWHHAWCRPVGDNAS
jgi:hypothetical protein